jgi:hypothetical protein
MIDDSIKAPHHRAVTEIVRFLEITDSHLSPDLQKVAKIFETATEELLKVVPSVPMLRETVLKMLETKNHAVVAAISAREQGLTYKAPEEAARDAAGSVQSPPGTADTDKLN